MTIQGVYEAIQARGVQALLINALSQSGRETRDYVPLLAEETDSDSAVQDYPWLGDEPAVQDVTDRPMVFTDMTVASYSLRNRTYAAGIAVKREEFEDDNLGAIKSRIAKLGTRMNRHRNKLMIDTLVGGVSTPDFTGANFLADSHPPRTGVGGGGSAQDNLLAGTGTGAAAISTDFGSATAALASFLDESGEPLNEEVGRFTIVAPHALEQNIMDALVGKVRPVVVGDAGTSIENVSIGGRQYDFIFSARLADQNDWYVGVGDPGFRPLIFQNRIKPKSENLEEGSSVSIEKGKYLYTVRGRYVPGYGMWQSLVKIVNGG